MSGIIRKPVPVRPAESSQLERLFFRFSTEIPKFKVVWTFDYFRSLCTFSAFLCNLFAKFAEKYGKIIDNSLVAFTSEDKKMCF